MSGAGEFIWPWVILNGDLLVGDAKCKGGSTGQWAMPV